jgi:hypothetical protein
MSNSPIFEIAFNGVVLDDKFTDEESANTLAGQRRTGPDQKIVVYAIGSRRHQKAFEQKLTPHNPSAPPAKK